MHDVSVYSATAVLAAAYQGWAIAINVRVTALKNRLNNSELYYLWQRFPNHAAYSINGIRNLSCTTSHDCYQMTSKKRLRVLHSKYGQSRCLR